MITVNTRERDWQPGLTVQELMDQEGFIFWHIIVRVNGDYVAEEQYSTAKIADGDEVLVLHLIAGG